MPGNLARSIAVLGALFATTHAAGAQLRDSLALERRAAQIGALIGGAAPSFDTVFNAAFLASVPPAQLRTLATQLAGLGRVQKIALVGAVAEAPSAARFEIETEKSYSIPMTLVVESSGKNLISGLLFGAPTMKGGTIQDVLKEFSALPGKASLFVARVDGKRLTSLAALNTGRAFGIGSRSSSTCWRSWFGRSRPASANGATLCRSTRCRARCRPGSCRRGQSGRR